MSECHVGPLTTRARAIANVRKAKPTAVDGILGVEHEDGILRAQWLVTLSVFALQEKDRAITGTHRRFVGDLERHAIHLTALDFNRADRQRTPLERFAYLEDRGRDDHSIAVFITCPRRADLTRCGDDHRLGRANQRIEPSRVELF